MCPRVWVSACLALLGLSVACGSNEANGDAAAAGAGSPSVASGGTSAGAGAPANAGGAEAKAGNGALGGGGNGAGLAGTASQAGAGTAGDSAGGTSSGGAAAGGAGGAAGAAAHAFKGVANAACGDLAAGRLSASWWYNWTTSPGSCKTGEFVPMISGKNEKTPEAVSAALNGLKTAGYRTVLGFNEPNKADQSNLLVADVVKLWPSLSADADVRVSSPATSADAKVWFEDFMTQVDAKSLRVDFVAVHWYGWNAGSCNDAKELESYITWAEKFKRPIWITEFGCMNASNPSADVVQKFYAAAVEMFGRHTSIERYAWYPWNTNNELVTSGNLTALGTAFGQAASLR
jgi:Glycosyl hydrolase catalytic core